jgi:hypothetical protein
MKPGFRRAEIQHVGSQGPDRKERPQEAQKAQKKSLELFEPSEAIPLRPSVLRSHLFPATSGKKLWMHPCLSDRIGIKDVSRAKTPPSIRPPVLVGPT